MMKTTILLPLFFFGTLFASNTPPIPVVKKKKSSIGHFIFSRGCYVPLKEGAKVLYLDGLAYQTKIWESFPIHSLLIELQGAGFVKAIPGKSCSALNMTLAGVFPKISAIRYLNPTDDTRFFFEFGGAFDIRGQFNAFFDIEENATSKELKIPSSSKIEPLLSSPTTLSIATGQGGFGFSAVVGFGMEFGPANDAICRFAISYLHPLEHEEYIASVNRDKEKAVSEKVPSNHLQYNFGAIAATFGVGF